MFCTAFLLVHANVVASLLLPEQARETCHMVKAHSHRRAGVKTLSRRGPRVGPSSSRLKPVKLVGMPRAVLVFEHSAVPMTKPVSVEQSKSEGV